MHMGLSSVLPKFDTAEMEHSLWFLINKNLLKFFKQKDNISWIPMGITQIQLEQQAWQILLFLKYARVLNKCK